MHITTPDPGGRSTTAPRIYYLHPRLTGWEDGLTRALDRVQRMGFDHVLVPPLRDVGEVDRLAGACRERDLAPLMDLDLIRFDAQHPLVAEQPALFALRREGPDEGPVDPRRPAPPRGMALARLRDPAAAAAVLDWATPRLSRWMEAGLAGFRVLSPGQADPDVWRRLIGALRQVGPGLLMIADTPGEPREAALALAGCGFDRLVSSLAWWDGRARWLAEEHEALRLVAPLIAAPEAPFGPRLAGRLGGVDPKAAHVRALNVAAASGSGLLVPMGFEQGARTPLDPARPAANEEDGPLGPLDLKDEVRAANRLSAQSAHFDGEMRLISGAAAAVTALLRTAAPDVRDADGALLTLINPSLDEAAEVAPRDFLPAIGGVFEPFARLDGQPRPYAPLAPGEVRLLGARRGKPVTVSARGAKPAAKAAAKAPRLVIEDVTPRIDGGAFAVKRVVGEQVSVEADIFGDGHEQLAAEVRWRALDEKTWSAARMEPLGNDRWRGAFPLARLGRHEFVIEAWLDRFGTYRRDLARKIEAKVAQDVDLAEGRALVGEAVDRTTGALQSSLRKIAAALDKGGQAARVKALLDEQTAALMDKADGRPFRLTLEPPQLVDAERLAARFSSWYELFPRSQTPPSKTGDPARHGTFDDVIARLPDIRAMGFDTLYFPPIHPIGETHRKGRNNALTAGPDDPGSPYAIGSHEGGHDAIHRQLGSFEDFRRLVAAAGEEGLEIALDFAIQCSPDHPWLKEHPGWFDWRPDGTVKYAENPPKKYQDIVNVDFYKPDAIPDLWLALRDIVLLWRKEGVRTFRVDNPHTKPLPFWEWMIADVRGQYPDVIFLSEAFTRPKVMYRLAKAGFSQSYTYFTWRHSKAEFTDYLTELTTTAPKEFFRPHFFVNTPDINPYFLQASGRAGFLIRAVLAATLSGLWGVYSGFELLESQPIPGKEEYKDSEKYEIRPREPRAPGDIIAEITTLNRLRRGHPALQTHLNVGFLPSSNDNILFYEKPSPDGRDIILVAVNLDPHGAHEADIELPLWKLGLSDEAAVAVHDLLTDQRFTWRRKWQRVRLDPGRPYAIWRIEAEGGG